jgi:addiction module HigA family antidote
MARKHKPVHPGEILKHEFLVPVDMSAYALAKEIGVSAPTVNDLTRGRRNITADMALRLARYWGTTAEFWMHLQARFDLEVAKDLRGAEFTRRIRPRERDVAELEAVPA